MDTPVVVVQRMDSTIKRINPFNIQWIADGVCFVNTYPVDSDLSGGVIHLLNNLPSGLSNPHPFVRTILGY